MNLETPGLAEFVDRQLRECGGHHEVDAGAWALLGVEASDADGNALAHELLRDAGFPHGSGLSEDERWHIYYVDTANRAAAMHWLDDMHRQLHGEVRLPSPAQAETIKQLPDSPLPHRLAQSLGEQHAASSLAAGCIREPALVRALLDRLHLREPLYYAAFQQLLAQHLIDMVVLLQKLISEDVDLLNEAMSGAVSRDPFLQSRQTAAAEIRRMLVEFCVINSLDQQKNTAVHNPYAAYMDLVAQGEELTLPLDGVTFTVTRTNFVAAIRTIRRNLYAGGEFERFDTQAPWMRNDIAHPFRFIKRRLEMHRDLPVLDGLFMLERAVEG